MAEKSPQPVSRTLAAAQEYLSQGLAPIPVAYRTKRPVTPEWQTLSISTDNASYYFSGEPNIGLILGERSGGLVDCDLDCAEAIVLAPRFLPPTNAVFGRKSKPASHFFYRSNLHLTEAGASLVARDAGKVVAELRIGAEPAQTVAPPSTHESGEAIEWQPGTAGEPGLVDGPVLLSAFHRLAAATIVTRHWIDGARNATVNALAGWLARLGWSEDEAIHFVTAIAEATDDPEVKSRVRAVRDTYKKHVAGKRVTGLTALSKLLGSDVTDTLRTHLAPALPQMSDLPDVTSKGIPKSTLLNTKTAIALLGIESRFDLFKLRHEVNGQPIQEFAGPLTDHVIHEIRSVIRNQFGFEPQKQTVLDAIQTLSNHHRFHPVRDYLDSLNWDGVPRLDQWLITYGGAEDTPFIRGVGAIVLIAAVRRVRQPGVKADEMLVLESEQGTNKSQALAILAVKPEWFSDQLPLGVRGREAIEATAGSWIIEVAELQGMRKSDIERVKAWMSASSDRGRMAYGITVTDAPRQFIVIGTTNSDQYLRDQTGNRRFWPAKIGRFDLEALQRDRDQLWAEAAAREAAGESIRLHPSLWEVAADEQLERVIDNPFLAVLDRYLREKNAEGGDADGPPLQGTIEITAIWELLGIRVSQRHQGAMEQLADAMKTLGWIKSRRRKEGGQRSYVYQKGNPPHRPIATLPADADGTMYPAYYDDVPVDEKPKRRREDQDA